MIEIKQQFLMKAINQLQVLGCKYAIQLPDGQVIGDLEIVKPTSIKEKKKRNSFKQYGFKAKLVGLPVGEVAVFDPPEGISTERLQGIITGLAGHAWGNGNYTSTQCNGQVQILRIA